jgi:hypothetical protein
VSIVVVNSFAPPNANVIVSPTPAPVVSSTVILVAPATGEAVKVALNQLATATGLSVLNQLANVKFKAPKPCVFTLLAEVS